MEESEPEATPTAESAQEAVASSFGRQEDVYVEGPNIISQNNLVVSEAHESPSKALSASPIVSLESDEHVSVEHNDELVEAVAPTFVEATEQETIAKIPCGVEFAEKVEPINTECFEDAEEEEKEGSQQISVSEMSGTQPTEESRPGSAGLAGSVWRAGALFSELDSEDVSCSQHGASELSAPGVLEGTESMDDLGEASLKGADGEGASVGSPDFEKVPDILNNEDEDDSDRVCDMDVGSERAEDSHKQIHDYDEEDEDVEMASEGVTESGLESYGNADEDDLTDDYRLDNLNRIQPPPSSINSSAGPWNQASCLVDAPQPSTTILTSPSSGSCLGDPETQEQLPVQASLDASFEKGPTFPLSCNISEPAQTLQLQSSLTSEETDICPKPDLTQTCMSGMPVEQTSDSTKDASKPDYVKDGLFSTETHSEGDLEQTHLKPIPDVQSNMQDLDGQLDHADEEEEPETLPADDLLGGQAATVSSSATEDEASETEGEMQINDLEAEIPAIENSYRSAAVTQNLSTLEEREETGGENEVIGGGGGNETPQSATSAASYGFDYMTSSSNAQSSAESCSKSPGIFSLENEDQLPDEAKDPSLLNELTLMPTSAAEETIVSVKEGDIQSHQETQDMFCGESVAVPVKSGLTDPSSPPHLEEEQGAETQPPYYSTVCEKTDGPVEAPATPSGDPAKAGATASRAREPGNKGGDTSGTENDEEEESRKLLELQLKQQEEELMQRQQIMNWQKELQQQPPKPKAHTPVLLSPTTPLTTIYETVEKSDDDEETLDQSSSLCPKEDRKKNGSNICSHHTRTSESITLNRETPPDLKIQSPVGSPERPPPLEFDWGKKVDIVQQLINQTLLLTGDGCSPLLLLPGGAGGTLSPLESSLWPNLLPPLTPPSATVTSVSSFSPEATGSSAQGEWTVVELETHH
ncbi:hypothetical protein DNTS_007715 [Danionella cerebrum]|uniref:BTB/POZ domain-containing protein n=1 Tax=Danionella cerebrum TaxID=2873325 RepID=A0A553QRT1_9TELE|nr:hypothetical protein DNTS_007715 [Danionella translucida]